MSATTTHRIDMPAPGRHVAVPVERLRGDPRRDLMMQFASLGDSCEFGFAQRAYAAEPFDLLRWAATPLPALLDLLNSRFAEIGDPRYLRSWLTPRGEYLTEHTRYGFRWHAFARKDGTTPEALHRLECARVPRLAEMMVDYLTEGHRIFVIRREDPLTEADVVPLPQAMRRYGQAPLLFVIPANGRATAGTVERLGDGLLRGYIDRFADPAAVPRTTDVQGWLRICQSAWMARNGIAIPPPRLGHIMPDELTCSTEEDLSISAQSHIQLSRVLMQQGKLTEAEQELRRGIELDPADAGCNGVLSRLLVRQGRIEEAVTTARKAASLDPGQVQARSHLASLLLRTGDNFGAEQEQHAAIALEPNTAALYVTLGHILVRLNRVDDAVVAARRAVELDPRRPQFHALLGGFLLRNGDPAAAEQAHLAAIELDPNVAAFHANLAGTLGRQDRVDQAIQAIRRAVALDEGNSGFRVQLGALMVRQGDLTGAERELRAAIEIHPNVVQLHNQIAHVVARQGRIDEAIAAARHAITLDGSNAHMHAVLGGFLMQNGALEAAEQELKAAVVAQPGIAQFHFSLSHVLSRQGRGDDAIASAQRASELVPANDAVRRRLDVLLAARQTAEAAAPPAAAPALVEAVPLKPPKVPPSPKHKGKRRSGSRRKGR
jgi:Tfp pilus assembly protein PilF